MRTTYALSGARRVGASLLLAIVLLCLPGTSVVGGSVAQAAEAGVRNWPSGPDMDGPRVPNRSGHCSDACGCSARTLGQLMGSSAR